MCVGAITQQWKFSPHHCAADVHTSIGCFVDLACGWNAIIQLALQHNYMTTQLPFSHVVGSTDR